jgi:hypothetical protein
LQGIAIPVAELSLSRESEGADGPRVRDFIHTGGAKLCRPGLDR